jgi:hypothetical protein
MFESWLAPFLNSSRIRWKTFLRFQRVNLL